MPLLSELYMTFVIIIDYSSPLQANMRTVHEREDGWCVFLCVCESERDRDRDCRQNAYVVCPLLHYVYFAKAAQS